MIVQNALRSVESKNVRCQTVVLCTSFA